MKTFDFVPADTLFCRDQKPLAAGHSFGRGANWPLPTVLHSAIRTALLRELPSGLPRRRSEDGHERRGLKRGKVASTAYQWLNLHGPFPVDEGGTLYFPVPRDLVPVGDNTVDYLRIISNTGQNNLPTPLAHLAASFAPPSKTKLPDWIPAATFQQYLEGKPSSLPSDASLWDSEHRIGIAINSDSHTAEDGKLYAAEHLRLREGVKLRFAVSRDPHDKEQADLADKILQLGGEQRFGKVTLCDDADFNLPGVEASGRLVKWVLLTPSIFIHGWRPGWIDETGQVKLRDVNKSKRAEKRRDRDHTAGWQYDPGKYGDTGINAALVAACVGKPQVIGGWDDHPKPTHLAVPSGSVYYFQAGGNDDATKLVEVLQGRCRSDFFGEKGLGLGVCGTWQHQDQTTFGNVPTAATNLKPS